MVLKSLNELVKTISKQKTFTVFVKDAVFYPTFQKTNHLADSSEVTSTGLCFPLDLFSSD